MASIRKVPNGWQAVWSVTGSDGKRKQPSKVFPTKREAMAHAARMSEEVEQRGISDPQGRTMRTYLTQWIDSRRGKKSPTTIRGDIRNANLLCRHVGHIKLQKLSAFDLDQAYDRLRESGLSGRSVLHIHKLANASLRQARKWKFVSTAVSADATPPKPGDSPARALSDDEIGRILAAVSKSKVHPAIDLLTAFLISTGCRRSEALGLCWDCVDLETGDVVIARALIHGENNEVILQQRTKTRTSQRTIRLPKSVVERMREHWTFTAKQMLAYGKDYRREPAFVFAEAGGRAPYPNSWTTRFHKIFVEAGVTDAQAMHGFRHSHATQLFAQGVDLVTVSRRLGHAKPSITANIYLHGDPERDRQAADIIGERLEKWQAKSHGKVTGS